MALWSIYQQNDQNSTHITSLTSPNGSLSWWSLTHFTDEVIGLREIQYLDIGIAQNRQIPASNSDYSFHPKAQMLGYFFKKKKKTTKGWHYCSFSLGIAKGLAPGLSLMPKSTGSNPVHLMMGLPIIYECHFCAFNDLLIQWSYM